jgi:hypothetical protein
VSLPKCCSFRSQHTDCGLPPNYILSVQDNNNDEYMIGAVCDLHKDAIKLRIQDLQSSSKIPKGKIKFNPVVILGTNCIKGLDEGYDDIRFQ